MVVFDDGVFAVEGLRACTRRGGVVPAVRRRADERRVVEGVAHEKPVLRAEIVVAADAESALVDAIAVRAVEIVDARDRMTRRLESSHVLLSDAVFGVEEKNHEESASK